MAAQYPDDVARAHGARIRAARIGCGSCVMSDSLQYQLDEMDALEGIPSLAALRFKLEDLETIEGPPWARGQRQLSQEGEPADVTMLWHG